MHVIDKWRGKAISSYKLPELVIMRAEASVFVERQQVRVADEAAKWGDNPVLRAKGEKLLQQYRDGLSAIEAEISARS